MNEYLESHANILHAYLSRLSLADIKVLLAAHQACWDASMSHGTLEQIKKANEARQVAITVVRNVVVRDFLHVDHCIRKHEALIGGK